MSRAQIEIENFDVNYAFDNDTSDESGTESDDEVPEESSNFELPDGIWLENEQEIYQKLVEKGVKDKPFNQACGDPIVGSLLSTLTNSILNDPGKLFFHIYGLSFKQTLVDTNTQIITYNSDPQIWHA